jgi:hypothetical protein
LIDKIENSVGAAGRYSGYAATEEKDINRCSRSEIAGK